MSYTETAGKDSQSHGSQDGGGEPSCPPVSKNVLINVAMRRSYQRSKDSKMATFTIVSIKSER